MDSLPKQPIDSLPAPKRRKAYMQVGLLCAARGRGIDSLKELARESGFHSVETMRISLGLWGLSSLLPISQDSGQNGQKTPRERKAWRVGGDPVALPSPANAAHLFERTRGFIKHEITFVSSLKETLQGGRFMSEAKDGPAKGTAGRLAWGGQWFPHPDLTRLIGSYIVEYGGDAKNVERLLEALHPEPDEANRKQLSLFLYGIDHDAKGGPKQRGDGLVQRVMQCAALIRGLPEIPPGRKDPSITSSEQFAVWEIREKLEEGLAEERVSREVREDWNLPPDEYRRLRRLAEEGLA